MAHAQHHISHVVRQTLLSALDDIPTMLASRRTGDAPAPPGGLRLPAPLQEPIPEPTIPF
eukprot:4057120-Prorocentrum_lima.AAC.1